MNILWRDIENCVFCFSSVSYAFILTSIDDSQQNQLLLNAVSYYQVVANGNFLLLIFSTFIAWHSTIR